MHESDSAPPVLHSEPRQRRRELLSARLFADPALATWAILDGAAVPKLVRNMGTHAVESACLFAGQLEPSLARVAPYLVRLRAQSEFTDWVLELGWGRSWGIFLHSTAELAPLRKHLRRFLRARAPDGRVMQFRYYDPRVLRLYLPTCNGTELDLLFGAGPEPPVRSYAAEAQGGQELLLFSRDPDAVRVETVSIG